MARDQQVRLSVVHCRRFSDRPPVSACALPAKPSAQRSGSRGAVSDKVGVVIGSFLFLPHEVDAARRIQWRHRKLPQCYTCRVASSSRSVRQINDRNRRQMSRCRAMDDTRECSCAKVGIWPRAVRTSPPPDKSGLSTHPPSAAGRVGRGKSQAPTAPPNVGQPSISSAPYAGPSAAVRWPWAIWREGLLIAHTK